MSDKILQAREARIRLAGREMSQSALARVLGVSKSTISYWLAGARVVTPERQRQIVEVLGGSARSLFAEPGDEHADAALHHRARRRATRGSRR